MNEHPPRASNDVANAYDTWHAAHVGVPQPVAPWHKLALRYLGSVQDLRVLEIGCGRGEFTRLLAERGAQVTAMDISPYAVEYAAELISSFPGANAEVGDICSISSPDETYDLVVSLETVEHSPDPTLALQELVRVAKPGGRLIITTPNYLSLVGVYRLIRNLGGRPFSELGQPVNHWTTTVGRARTLRRLGCTVKTVDGEVQLLVIPFWRQFELRWLERPKWLMRWICLHGVTVAIKPTR